MTNPPRPRPRPQVEEHTLHAYPNEIRRIIATNTDSGRLLRASRPVPGPANDGRVIVQLTLRPVQRTEVATRPAPRPTIPEPARRPRREPRTRSVGATVALVAGSTVAIGTVGYFLIEALVELLAALTASADLIVGVLAVVLFLGVLVVRAVRGGGNHCPGCRG